LIGLGSLQTTHCIRGGWYWQYWSIDYNRGAMQQLPTATL